MAIRPRGTAQIRTLAAIRGSGTHSNERHVHQFQIASLELERTRRGRERLAALSRVDRLNERLLEIEARIRKHQEALGIAGATAGGAAEPPAGTAPEKRRTLRY